MARRGLQALALSATAVVGSLYAVKARDAALSDAGATTFSDEVPPRATQLEVLKGSSPVSQFDILVIGGGATGCGIAVDAATRGLRTALVEREDFAAGTSSRSTKLVHGGVRYLEKAVKNADPGQLKLVYEALKERAIILHNAPHLTAPLPTMMPCYSWWEIPYYYAGMKLYDLIAWSRVLHLSRFHTASESREMFPTLAASSPDGRSLKGTVVYFDGQMNDARLNVSLACTAALAGAAVLNHAEVVGLSKDETTGKVTGARVRDTVSNQTFDVHAKVTINATGPFCDSIRRMSDGEARSMVTTSSGVHVVLPDYFSPDSTGLIVPKTKDGRVVFMLPWLGKTIAGTTDAEAPVTQRPEPHEDEINFILDAINGYLSVPVRRQDVLSAWSGLRPLATNPDSKDTKDIVRDHVVTTGDDGLISVSGGKWTTYRLMAEHAVNAAVRAGKLAPQSKCVTENLLLVGAEGWDPSLFASLTQQYVRMKRTYSGKVVPGVMDTAVAKHLTHSYGGRADRVAYIAQVESLGKKLAHGYPDLEAEVVYCARYEYCASAVDFIARRSRLAFLDTAAAARALPRVVDLLGQELGWDKRKRKAELADAQSFLETFKAKSNALFVDGKH